MDSLELNKAAAAVLLAGIAFVGSGLLGRAIVSPDMPEKAHIAIAEPQGATPAAAGAPEQPISVLLASADAKAGEGLVKAQGCVACHSFNKDGKAGVGPNLYGVVGAPHGHMQGYDYTGALKSKQGPWTFDALNQWLTKPSAYAPGTKMSYAGLSDPKKRADIIEYLRTDADSPQPKPTPEPGAAAVVPANTNTAGVVGTGVQPQANAAGAGDGGPIEARLASADPKAGEADTKRVGCIACHTFTEGGKAGLGPNLYGVVGGPHGHMEGFNYSAVLKGKQGPWTFAALDEWLKKPAAYAPGTKMTFAGVADPKQRADIIDYLRTLAKDPIPVPKP